MARSETDSVPESENRFTLLIIFLILMIGSTFAAVAAAVRRVWAALLS
jgi:hypothetical protein